MYDGIDMERWTGGYHQEPVKDPVSGIPLPVFPKPIDVIPNEEVIGVLLNRGYPHTYTEPSTEEANQAERKSYVRSSDLLFEDCSFGDDLLRDVTEDINRLDESRLLNESRKELPPYPSAQQEIEGQFLTHSRRGTTRCFLGADSILACQF